MKKTKMRPTMERQPHAGRLAGTVQERSNTLPTEASLSESEFEKLVEAHGISGKKTIHALRLHFVKGLSRTEAARRGGIHASAITRAAYRFDRPVCPHCGQPVATPGTRTLAKKGPKGPQKRHERPDTQRLPTPIPVPAISAKA